MSRTCLGLILAGFGLLLAVGCSTATSVSGTVTYEGQPVDNGYITFAPADGRGPSAGGPIAAGAYQLDKITPGTKQIQIIGVKAVPFARNSEDMARMAAEAAQRGDTTGIIDRADEVPADAAGNNAQVEIKPGPQTLDFHLKKAGERRA